MLDVNIDAVIAVLSGKQEVENIRSFLVPEKGLVTINLQAGHRGYLELQAISGGPIFLYRGANYTAVQIEGLMKEPNPIFDLAAAIGQSAHMQMESNMGQITLFSEKNSLGFIRSCQYPYPPYNTQAKLA
jgi:hypothetical protein